MKLPSNVITNELSILEPRWHDRVALIACHKVGAHNIIKFTNANNYKGDFYIGGGTIRKYPKESLNTKNGGKMPVYAVPLDELVLYEGRNA